MSDDVLEAVLRAALAEQAIRPETLDRFTAALQEHGRILLDRRVGALERSAAIRDAEVGFLRAAVAALQEEKQALIAEREKQREAAEAWRDAEARGRDEAEALRREWRSAADAHDRLLAHHRQFAAYALRVVDAAATSRPWAWRQVRERLRALASLLRGELS